MDQYEFCTQVWSYTAKHGQGHSNVGQQPRFSYALSKTMKKGNGMCFTLIEERDVHILLKKQRRTHGRMGSTWTNWLAWIEKGKEDIVYENL